MVDLAFVLRAAVLAAIVLIVLRAVHTRHRRIGLDAALRALDGLPNPHGALDPAPSAGWRDPAGVATLRRALSAHGFEEAGAYGVPATGGLVAGLVDPDRRLVAAVHEDAEAGVWLEVGARSACGSTVALTTRPASPHAGGPPPGEAGRQLAELAVDHIVAELGSVQPAPVAAERFDDAFAAIFPGAIHVFEREQHGRRAA